MAQFAGQPSPSPERRTVKQRTIVVLGARGVGECFHVVASLALCVAKADVRCGAPGKSASVIQYVDDHFVDGELSLCSLWTLPVVHRVLIIVLCPTSLLTHNREHVSKVDSLARGRDGLVHSGHQRAR